jgi:hypothetical protein
MNIRERSFATLQSIHPRYAVFRKLISFLRRIFSKPVTEAQQALIDEQEREFTRMVVSLYKS